MIATAEQFVWNLFLTFIVKDCADVRAVHNSSLCFLIFGVSQRGIYITGVAVGGLTAG